MPPDTTYAVFTTSELQKWATGEHQAIFGQTYFKYNSNILGDGVCLLEVQLTVSFTHGVISS